MHKKTVERVLLLCLAAAIILSAINISLIFVNSSKAQKAMEELSIPVTIELMTISGSSCADCFDVTSILEGIMKGNVNVSSEKTLDFASAEAQELIAQYNIEKLPTMIVRGQVEKLRWTPQWKLEPQEKPEYALFVDVAPPYLTPDGIVKGLAALTHIIDKSCSQCSDLSAIIRILKQNGVKFSQEETINYDTDAAQALILKLGIEAIPALVVSNDILEYPAVAKIWQDLNVTEKQGLFAVHGLLPPYLNLKTNKVEGLVALKYLDDTSCQNCYDVTLHKQILSRGGIIIAEEKTIDVNSVQGKALIEKYSITKVPTVLISPEVAKYTGFTQVWKNVGDVSDDGWFVMRSVELLGTYKDLTTAVVVDPQAGQ